MYFQIMEEESYIDPEIESTEEQHEENDSTSIIITCTEEKETNTECNFCPEAGKRKISCLSADDRLAIKRSQTFSPTPQLTKTQYICRYFVISIYCISTGSYDYVLNYL